MRTVLTAIVAVAGIAGAASAQQTIGLVDFDGTELGLTGYTNSVVNYTATGARTSGAFNVPANATTLYPAGDSFWPMNRGNIGVNNVGMPFSISDDSVTAATGNTVFATDNLGFAGNTVTSGFFGVTDTVNGVGSDTESATFTFDITGFTGLSLSVDMIAMGDFELADIFTFSYSIDGAPFQTLFTVTADEAINQSYTMDSGTVVTLDDPLRVNGGTILTDAYQTFSDNILGSGSSLAIRFSAVTDGAEGFGFDNLTVRGIPTPGAVALFGVAGLVAARRRRA